MTNIIPFKPKNQGEHRELEGVMKDTLKAMAAEMTETRADRALKEYSDEEKAILRPLIDHMFGE